jgi:hypothetical protein
MLRSAAVTLLLISGLLPAATQAEEDGIFSCRERSGSLFFTDDPKHFPPSCQPFQRDPGQGGLILVPGSALPKDQNKIDAPAGPWRIDDWRLQKGERTSS